MAEINLEDLEPNSKKYKEERRHADDEPPKEKPPKLKSKVKKNDIVQTKKSLGQKFQETFVQEDIKTVRNYVVDEVVVPGFKNLILDCLSMFFFKEAYSGRRGRRDDDEYTSYSSYYSSGRKKKKRKKERDEDYDDDDRTVDYQNIVLKRKDAAQDIVDELRRRIKKYDRASVADLLDLIEVTGKYTDNNWGWTDPEDIGIRRVSNGFLIDVADAELLD